MPKKIQKQISIILVNWNSYETTKKCIENIEKTVFFKDNEIFVVDNGSVEHSTDKLKKNFPFIKIIENKKNMGFAYALNQGYKEAHGPLIAYVNSDVILLDGWLEEAVKVFESDPKIAIAGVREVSQKDIADIAKLEKIRKEPNIEKMTLPIGWVTSKEIIKKVGFLDSEFFSPAYGEEADWNFRARKFGFKVVRASKSNVIHHGSAVIKNALGNKKYFILINYHRLRAMLFNLSVFDLIKFIPGLGLIFLNSFFNGTFFYILKSYWLNLMDWKLILSQRKKNRMFIPFKEPKFTIIEE